MQDFKLKLTSKLHLQAPAQDQMYRYHHHHNSVQKEPKEYNTKQDSHLHGAHRHTYYCISW